MGYLEKESYLRFKDRVPRNKFDWEGTVVMYSAGMDAFFNISFGSGDNLDSEDIDNGFDDYIMVDQYKIEEGKTFSDVMMSVVGEGCILEGETEGLEQVDGGQLLIRRLEWKEGDIRRFIENAMEFAGYGTTEKEKWMDDVIFICSEKEDR